MIVRKRMEGLARVAVPDLTAMGQRGSSRAS
jgi:hypothetical protein